MVAKLKEMKCPSESTKSLTSLLKVLIYFFLYMYDNRSWHFFRCPFFVLFGCTFACHFLSRIFSLSRPRERKRFFMPLQEFKFYFKTGKNLWFALKNAFDCFWLFKRWKLFWKHSKMTLWKTLLHFDDGCYVYLDAKQNHSASFSTLNSTLNTSLRWPIRMRDFIQLCDSIKIIVCRYQLGAVKWSLIVTT